MSVPVYLFLFAYLAMLAYGAYRLLATGTVPLTATAPPAVQPLTAFVLLRYGKGPIASGHVLMGFFFGSIQLAYGVYLYFTEQRRNET